MNVTQAAWATEEGLARARELWDSGARTKDIGRAVGVSRDAIVGYARRHRWGPHPQPPTGMAQRAALKAARTALEASAAAPAVPAPKPRKTPSPANGGLRVACRPDVLAVPSPLHRQCQWIAPECNGRPWRMCGAPVARPGVAYCAEHFPRCYHRPPRWSYAPEASA